MKRCVIRDSYFSEQQPVHCVLRRVVVCGNILQRVAVCCQVLQGVVCDTYVCRAAASSLRVVVRCSVWQCVLQCVVVCCSVSQCVASVCYSVLPVRWASQQGDLLRCVGCAAVCCSVLQCV